MVFFKNFIKDKRGVVSVFSLWIIMFSVLFTAFLIDIGLAFYSRVHLQGIADSASMAGDVYPGFQPTHNEVGGNPGSIEAEAFVRMCMSAWG